jgi:hypothetical protein
MLLSKPVSATSGPLLVHPFLGSTPRQPGHSFLKPRAASRITLHCGAIIALSLLVFPIPALAADSRPFSDHEILEYQVKWNPPAWMFFMPEVTAGKIIFKVTARNFDNGVLVHRFEGSAISTSSLLKVNDWFESQTHGAGLCSEWAHKQTHEGKRHRDVEIRVESEKNSARITEKDIGVDPPKVLRDETLKDFPACVHDLVAGAYRARSFPMKPGEIDRLVLTDNGKYVEVTLKPLKQETLQTATGIFSTQKVEVLSFLGGLVRQKGTFYIWFTEDERHLPVKFEMKVKLGHVYGTLIRIQE